VQTMKRLITAVLAAMSIAASTPSLIAQCYISYGSLENAKPNKLYLYFPTASDATFPSYGSTNPSPATAFNISDLDPAVGTVAQYRDAIRGIVVTDYCEFNVQVLQTTTNPDSMASPPARRLTVAIGSDFRGTSSGATYGEAEHVDGGDNFVVDHARIYAGSYELRAGVGSAGGELAGANSTLARWANAIGGTAAHEGGHTYGLAHSDDASSLPTEDVLTNHIMPAGTSFTLEQRIGNRRHFSDTTFSIMATTVGLSVQTVWNWDLKNPNSADAHALRMEILTTAATLTLGGSYGGLRTPWVSPTISTLPGTVTFRGTAYNHFAVTWSIAQPWANSGNVATEPSGIVGPGKEFHTGATFINVDFNATDPVIVHDITLLDGSSNPLPLHPRVAAFDNGTLDAGDGDFSVLALNANEAQPLILRHIKIQELPRVMAIDSMMADKPMLTFDGLAVRPWSTKTLPDRTLRGQERISIANLKQGHHIFINHDRQKPNRPVTVGTPGDRDFLPEVNEDEHGIATDLFPSTTVYLSMTVVDPDAEHWDAAQGRMVRGPVESKVFYQFKGIRPDLNHNGKDDLVDIATGTSRDNNADNVPDEVQNAGSGGRWLLYPFFGRFLFDNGLPIDDGNVFGLRLARNTAPLAVEGELGLTRTHDVLHQSGNVVQASINTRWFLGGTPTVKPFLIAGAGGLWFRNFTSDEQSAAVNAGGGVDIRVTPSIRLRLDARDFVAFGAYSAGTTNNWQFTVGLGFPLP
jgi:hypothetical protein